LVRQEPPRSSITDLSYVALAMTADCSCQHAEALL